MQIKIKTLTPMWTGNIKGKSTKLRETSILGSLRWWFEAIVRGFGAYACDSVGELTKKCELDYKKYKAGKDPKELICPVCYVFGTTNWARRFRLRISGELNPLPFVIVKADKRKDHKGWFLGTKDSGGLIGILKVKIYEDYWMKNILALLLNVSSSWGIGAKYQNGFGICKFEGQYNISEAINETENLISKFKKNSQKNNELLPNIKNSFFVKIIINEDIDSNIKEAFNTRLYKDPKNQINIEEYLQHIPGNECRFYPTAPLIRYWLRSLFRNGNDDLRHFLFGFVSIKGIPSPICRVHLTHVNKKGKGYFCPKCKRILKDEEIRDKTGSKIFVSHIYRVCNNKWAFKIWGYIPKILPNNESREKVLQKLFIEIKENKNFVNVLNLDRHSTEVEWYEISRVRSDISSVEDLVGSILEVNNNELCM